ncbi:bifunctional glutamate N-acetyltransferase/amino-acid acetyltransferase ArgJ [Staphylococcus succinus]|uniref:Arginine biosynthesis bifunctional protein ArgJ n=1 Tax=Staphylococcus succinus TaxID=61015 RepID=A0ABX5IL46_9STAP|nr:bifunctional glutamate N-acetyltransferase/amino-acid acetyltransferase ArgJ [Staphylococcus succinus]MBU0438546.1 bifunctional glutamate N-acetyltransferase/amino-acid acetyltransferase ArgJ [Staphylococcus succinus]MDH9160655.1 bifunctional glutamate N-acetyltransferase/amino-acid acetyltransferase ArgJ [Staphylococcus succinus]MEB7462788.1 bifunctional glutamate N-acetyltransferase/amino-acid acetyltransferase ArgJ [Staphylococcus succinus]MEB8123638.1 bifunctional glutamate N-acetyltrans
MKDIETIDTLDQLNIDLQGDVSSPLGFIAGGLHAGLRRTRKDFGWIYSTTEANAAGVYTLNRFKAAPLIVTEACIKNNQVLQAIVVNSANANACTGEKGLQDAKDTQAWVAKQLNITQQHVGIASTGVIGSFLPMDKIQHGTEHVMEEQYNHGEYFNQAILTTDTATKHLSVQVEIEGKTVTIGGTAKGSGMIHPNMATMLGFITTDANIESDTLDGCLRESVDESFNMITVDGDTSTNDMVLCMANGQANHTTLDASHPEWHKFEHAFNFVSQYLAKSIAKDGEGATKLVTAKVKGAITTEEARKIAKSIVSSSLVKTAIHGEDANFGRIVAAMGYASDSIVPSETFVTLAKISVVDEGMSVAFDEADLKAKLQEDNIVIEATVGQGNGEAAAYGCDLSYDYVSINASYRT